MEGRWHLIPRRRGITAVLVAILVAASVAGWWFAMRIDQQALGARADAVATPTARAIESRLEVQTISLLAAVQTIDGNIHQPNSVLHRLLPAPGSASALPIATATVEPGGAVVLHRLDPSDSSVPPSGTDLASTPAWRVALDAARDEGTPRIAAGAGPGAHTPMLIAAPVYGAVTAPSSVGQRRAAAQGYLVVVQSSDTLVGNLLPGPGTAVRAELVQGTTVLASSVPGGRTPVSARAVAVSVPGLTWAVYAWPSASRSILPWVVLAVGLGLAFAVALIAARATRTTEVLAREAVARADEVRLVARTGPLLQQSLELGDLLPAFVVEVGEELDLDRVGISLMSERGQLVQIFSLGAAGGDAADTTVVQTPPASVAAGADVLIPLQRSGRMVGVFTARARSGLGVARMEALRAVCDLLAAALGNAVLFQQEQDMVHRLRDLDRMKTSFLGSVSHELRTMVTAIAGFANLLSADAGPVSTERHAEYIERIQRNANSLGLLIDDLLDFARLERSGLHVVARPVDLSLLVPEIVEQMSSLLEGRDLAVDVEPGVVAQADPAAIERILVNLLSNAAKYTPSGTPVRVAVTHDGDRAVLTVADRGPGIPAHERTRVFGLFYRVDGPSTQAARGVGIGLALVAELTSLLHGTVIVTETPGGGALFSVSLPLSECAAEEAPPRWVADVVSR